MVKTNQSLATLIGSRICHDLISPVGAIQNGIELLALEGRSGPEMTLIEDSVANASARIRFMRVAFGAAGSQEVGEPEIRSILADLGRGGRVTYDWQAQACDRDALQAVFLAFLCLEAAMPRGGTVSATRDGADWVVSGAADLSRPSAQMWTMLCGGADDGSTLPAHVQFPLLAALMNDRGARVRVEDGETVMLRLSL